MKRSGTSFIAWGDGAFPAHTATGTDRVRPEVPNGSLQRPEDDPGKPGEEVHVRSLAHRRRGGSHACLSHCWAAPQSVPELERQSEAELLRGPGAGDRRTVQEEVFAPPRLCPAGSVCLWCPSALSRLARAVGRAEWPQGLEWLLCPPGPWWGPATQVVELSGEKGSSWSPPCWELPGEVGARWRRRVASLQAAAGAGGCSWTEGAGVGSLPVSLVSGPRLLVISEDSPEKESGPRAQKQLPALDYLPTMSTGVSPPPGLPSWRAPGLALLVTKANTS